MTSRLLSPNTVTWPGDDAARIEPASQISQGSHANTSKLSMSSHAGTHLDAPHHFIDGAQKVDELDLAQINGTAEVIDCTGMRRIEPDALRGKLHTGIIPLLKTDSSFVSETAPFDNNYVYLTYAAAQLVIEAGATAVGIDYLSISGREESQKTHQALLGAGVTPIEGLRLADVKPGRYTLMCLPLKLAGCDGAPVRAALIEGES